MKKHFIITILCFFSFINNIDALTNIELSKGVLIPNFSKSIKVYNVYLDKDIEEISIKCNKEENKIEVENEGMLYLEEGANTVNLNVKDTDGKITTYTININRGEIIENEESAYLKKLEIEGYYIEFLKDKLNYEINVEEIIDELKIKYEPENIEAKVEVTGGTNLNKSTNIIEIKVTSKNKENSNIYRITVNKILPTFKEKKLETNLFGKTELTKKEKIVIIIIISIISFLIILLAYVIIFSKKTSKKLNI